MPRPNDVIVTAWRPIEGGMLSKTKIQIMNDICKKYNKTPSQVAINWLISQENVVTIPGSRNIKHLKENLGALGWRLSQERILGCWTKNSLKKNIPALLMSTG